MVQAVTSDLQFLIKVSVFLCLSRSQGNSEYLFISLLDTTDQYMVLVFL